MKIAVTPEYSNRTGISLGVVLASMLGDHAAIGILMGGGAEKKEVLLNGGFNIGSGQRLLVSVGQLKQSHDYLFPSGVEKVGMTQNSAGLGYQRQLGSEFLRFLEVNGYVSKTGSRDLVDKTFSINNATLYELWNDPRRIAGGRVDGLQGRLALAPLTGSLVKVSLGYERLAYDLLTGHDSINRPTTGLEWQQQLGNGYRFQVGAESYSSQNRYTVGFERSLSDGGGRHTIGLNLIGVQGRDGLGSDQQVQLAYSYAFGSGAMGATSARRPAARLASGGDASPGSAHSSGLGDLLDQVATRPNYIPSYVIAKVDTTAVPTRLVTVAKGALPAGSRIDAATGDITVPLGVAVIGFAGITRNLAVFSNSGQFALGGNTLTVRPSQMGQPAMGATDSYVVTLNNAGGGTTTVKIKVSKGTVHIDSIVVPSDITAPTTTAGPSVSGTTHNSTTLSATIDENGTGYYLVQPAAAAAPSVAAVQAGTSFAMTANTAATPAITGLTAGTAYKIYFVAKDAANNVQATVQSVAVTITAAPDTTPDSFDFSNLSNQAQNTVVTTNTITITGIDTSVTASTTVGTLVKNGSDTGLASTTVNAGDTLAVKLTTSASPSTAINGTVTIGTGTDNFSVTTAAASLPAGYISQGGLTWSPNNATVPGGRSNWSAANSYCSTQTINGQTGWRLPTTTELRGLYGSSMLSSPPVGWELDFTWSSTPNGMDGHDAFALYDDYFDWADDGGSLLVTCVR